MTDRHSRNGAPTGAPLRVLGLAGWLVVPLLLVIHLFDLRRGVTGHPSLLTAHLVLCALVTLACAPVAWMRRRDLSRQGLLVLGLWGALLTMSVVGVLVTKDPRIIPVGVAGEHSIQTLASWRLWPLAGAGVTALAAFALALATPARERRDRLWWATWTMLLVTPVAGLRTMLARHTARLATGMGGAAVLHLPLLLCLGVMVGAAMDEGRSQRVRRASLVGAVLATGEVLATGSRAGMICLALFVAALVPVLWRRHRRAVLGFGLAGLVGVVALLVSVPVFDRLGRATDTTRQVNLHGAMNALQDQPLAWIYGVGSGRLWPWAAFDAGLAPVPPTNLMRTTFGVVATNPHSLYLGTLVELGLVGLGLLVATLGLIASGLVVVRRLGASWAFWPLVAVVAGFVAFALDHYLFKNLGVALWWWYVVAMTMGTQVATTKQ